MAIVADLVVNAGYAPIIDRKASAIPQVWGEVCTQQLTPIIESHNLHRNCGTVHAVLPHLVRTAFIARRTMNLIRSALGDQCHLRS